MDFAVFSAEQLERLVRVEKSIADKAQQSYLAAIGTSHETSMQKYAAEAFERYYEAYGAWKSRVA